jgi:hypothetical protein
MLAPRRPNACSGCRCAMDAGASIGLEPIAAGRAIAFPSSLSRSGAGLHWCPEGAASALR